MIASVMERKTGVADTKRGYSLDFLADQYCISVAFLRKLIREQKLKQTKIGTRCIVLAEDWAEFLNKEKNEN